MGKLDELIKQGHRLSLQHAPEKVIAARLPFDEHAAIKAACKAIGVPMGEFARVAIQDAAVKLQAASVPMTDEAPLEVAELPPIVITGKATGKEISSDDFSSSEGE